MYIYYRYPVKAAIEVALGFIVTCFYSWLCHSKAKVVLVLVSVFNKESFTDPLGTEDDLIMI